MQLALPLQYQNADQHSNTAHKPTPNLLRRGLKAPKTTERTGDEHTAHKRRVHKGYTQEERAQSSFAQRRN